MCFAGGEASAQDEEQSQKAKIEEMDIDEFLKADFLDSDADGEGADAASSEEESLGPASDEESEDEGTAGATTISEPATAHLPEL